MDKNKLRLRTLQSSLSYSSEEHLYLSSASSDGSSSTSSSPRLSSTVYNKYSKRDPILHSDDFSVPQLNKALLIALTILGFATRFYNISAADFSVWDESHFGKFAAQYIKGEFYHDVHPPLGKMLLGLSGWISGLSPNSNFDFGFHYASNVPYTFMRMFAATFGAALIPLAYATAIQLKMTNSAAAFAALMIIFDMALANISRFILLDPILLFFTATAVYGAAVFRNVRSRPFTSEWWLWLFVTGASLGCVSSVKMMGLFVVALVGLLTIQDLAGYLVDMRFQRITGIIFIKHFLYRSLLLIVLPLSIYISTFYIQFQILTRSSGQDDDIMSSLFQSSLVDTSLKDIPLFVAYGSRLTLKNNGPSGGILQTHIPGIIHPGREHHQAVSCSKQKTDYTHWLIEKQDVNNNDGSVTYVKDGDVVMLKHQGTQKYLWAEANAAPTFENAVFCRDRPIQNDMDKWKVEFLDNTAPDIDEYDVEAKDVMLSMYTKFRLRNVVNGCVLRSKFFSFINPNDATCLKSEKKDTYTVWNIEQQWNEKLPPPPPGVYKSDFWSDFIELHMTMIAKNNDLIPTYDLINSWPWQWPFATRGIRMTQWDDHFRKYYLVGNPFIWWGVAFSVVVYLMLLLNRWLRISFNRSSSISTSPIKLYSSSEQDMSMDDFSFAGQVCLGGWLLHYIPFYFMKRTLYLHHYLPALYFGILLFAFTIDRISSRLSSGGRGLVFFILIASTVGIFVYFYDFVYGFSGPRLPKYQEYRWFSTWNLYTDYELLTFQSATTGGSGGVGVSHSGP